MSLTTRLSPFRPAAMLVLLFTHPAVAQEIVSASPDTTIGLATGVITSDHDVVVDNQIGVVLLENLGSIPTSSDVIALGLDVNGDRLFALDTTTALSGGIVARPGDVVRFDGSTHSIEFAAAAAGVPQRVAVDATSIALGGLLLSFDTTVDLGGGLVVADEDLVVWSGSAFALVFEGSANGLDSALDVDGAQDIGGGRFLMSFDTTGQIGGVVFADEDVLRFNGTSWSLEFDASAADTAWASTDLDAIMVPEPDARSGLYAGLMLLGAFARRRPRRWIQAVPFLAMFNLIGPPAYAVDGVAEINETCAVQTGCFSGDFAGYPVTIDGSAGASYRLTSNLIVPSTNTDAIRVSAINVGIDLNNFAIIGANCVGSTVDCTPAAGTGVGIARTSGSTAVIGTSVKNGSITGMGGSGVQLGDQAEVSGLRTSWNRSHGISVGSGSTLWANTSYENGSRGIIASVGSTITANTTYRNVGNGIRASNGSTVSGNTSYLNGGRGIRAFNFATVSRNTTSQNTFDGIMVEGGSTVQGNTSTSNSGAGILASEGGSSIFDNTVTANAQAGIDCRNGGRSYVRGNSALQNTGFGLDLNDTTLPDAVYRENLIFDNTAGTVSGGNNRGDNSCRNLTGGLTACP